MPYLARNDSITKQEFRAGIEEKKHFFGDKYAMTIALATGWECYSKFSPNLTMIENFKMTAYHEFYLLSSQNFSEGP